MTHRPRRTLEAPLALAIGLATALAAVGPAAADHEPPRIGLTALDQEGAFFDLRMGPGERQDLRVELSNTGHDEVDARTYAADTYSIVNGGFGAELFGEDASGTTLWLDYRTREVSLPRDEALIIEFSVSVPEDAAPGEYITSIVAENAEPFSGSGAGDGLAIDQVNRTAIAVAIDVPGTRRPALQIGAIGHKVAAGMSFMTFEIANTGNVHLKPAGELVLRDSGDEPIATHEPAMDSVYAGTETMLEVLLGEELAPGDYCAELSLEDAETGARAATDCMPFTVSAIADPGDGGGSVEPAGIPVVQPVADAVADAPLIAVAALMAMGLVASGVYLALRRRAHR